MTSGDARTLRPVQHRCSAALVHNVILCVFQIRALLLPEKEDVESGHERRELIVDVLEHFRVFFKGAQEGRVRFERFLGDGDGGQFLEAGEEVRFAGAEVRGAEEEDAVGADVDGVDVGDFGRGAGCGVGEGSFDDDAA